MKMIFVNFPMRDVKKATEFYTALGLTVNPAFSDDRTTCLIWSDQIFFMLLSHERFAEFTKKKIVDASTDVQVLISLSIDTREGVDEIVEKGLAAGGTEPRPVEDYGYMYGRALCDLDGNTLEFTWMDTSSMPE